MKKKKFIVTMGGVVGLAVVTSLSLLLATGSSKPETFDASSTITLSMSENYNPEKTPPGFEYERNSETANLLGLDNSFKSRSISSITVNQAVNKDGDYYVGKDGTAEIIIEGKTHNLSIQSSLVSHHVLSNNHNLLTGSFETEIADESGKTLPTTIGFTKIVETGEEFFLVTIGTLEDGPVVLPFGDDSFGTQEIYDIIWSQANVEEVQN